MQGSGSVDLKHIAWIMVALGWPSGLQAQTQAPVGPVQMPPVTVTAQKEPADVQKLPVSVTAVGADTIVNAGVSVVSDAAIYAPNTNFTEFTARKLSNATFRGIGSSPSNPGITTLIDGVPQLNTNSSNVTLLEVEQIEFVRGPQSALYGRNTLGGIVNISTRRPSLSAWSGTVHVPFASESGRGIKGNVAGPLKNGKLGFGAAFDYATRDGFTTNSVTSNDLDSREAFSGRAQVVWTPSDAWETRVIVAGERARDGDYALGDLAALRADPFTVARDFEGKTDRDVLSTTFTTRRRGGRVNFSTTTGVVSWDTRDVTDLDYTPLPLVRRDNSENDLQFTHESRFASAPAAPVRMSDHLSMQWQAGVFLFTQNYEQDAINSYSPGSDLPSSSLRARSAPSEVRAGRRRSWVVRAGDDDISRAAGCDARRAVRPGMEGRGPSVVLRPAAPVPPVERRHGGEEFQQCLASGGRRVSRAAEPDDLRDVQPGLQGRRLQPVIARWGRGLRRGAYLERRGRMEVDLGRWPCDCECRRLLCRLGRHSAEPARSERAGPVLHFERRCGDEPRRRGRGVRAAPRARVRVRRRSATRGRGSRTAARRVAWTSAGRRYPTRRSRRP